MTWQPIETAPVERTILVWADHMDEPELGTVWPDGTVVDQDPERPSNIYRVTHWMPLPAPPIVKDDAIAPDEDGAITNAIAWAWSAPEDMEDVGGPEHQEAYRGLLATLDSGNP